MTTMLQLYFYGNISIGVQLDLSTPMEIGYIETLVENENSAKQQRKNKSCRKNLVQSIVIILAEILPGFLL